MSTFSFWFSVVTVLFLALPSFVPSIGCSGSRVRGRELKGTAANNPLFRPPNAAETAAFEAWVSLQGKKFELKKDSQQTKAMAQDSISSSTEQLDVQTYIVVDQSGSGQFSTLQAAIDSIEKDQSRTQRITIQINPGTYTEKVKVPKNVPYLTLQGGGRSNTLITHAETAGQAGSDIASATIAISAPNFIARNITFQNAAPAPVSGTVGGQATALYISGDQGAFYGVGFLGAQDTLYDHNGRHYFEDCYVEGSIDFIYGDGKSLYKNTQLNVIPATTNSLTAQKRKSDSDDSGFSFVDCSVTGAGRVYLGRAWGTHSRVVFAYTWLADIIIPVGWQDWSDPTRDYTVYYGEYSNSGPGANAVGRVAWSRQLTYAEAAPFLTTSFVDGESWISS